MGTPHVNEAQAILNAMVQDFPKVVCDILPPRIARGRISLLGPPQWDPSECLLLGQPFVGTETLIAAILPSRRRPTGGAVGLF